MRRTLAGMMAALFVLATPGVSAAEGDNRAGSSSGYNTGSGVGAEALLVSRSPGGGGGSSSSGRAGPAIDYQARYQSLIGAMANESLRETDRRAAEASRYHALREEYAECSRLAAHYRAVAYDRVRVVERVPVSRTVTVYEHIPYYENVRVAVTVYEHIPYYETVQVAETVWERIPIVEHYTVRVRRGWSWVTEHRTRISWVVRPKTVYRTERVLRWRVEARTTYRTERVLRWRVEARTVTFIEWHTVERWETRLVNAAALAAAAAYGICASHYAALVTAHEHQVAQRRSAWDAAWSGLNRQAHEAWRAVNTSCVIGERQGDFATQVCSYGEWRGFNPGSFSRTIRVVPPRPSSELIQQARDEVGPPPPVIRTSPRVEWEQIVHVPTWMWVEGGAWVTQTARADAGEAWAEATAVPVRVVWDMGNGERVTCAGPGTPYDENRPEAAQSTGCSYTYARSSAGLAGDHYTVTATVVYDVTWTGSGGAGGNLGTITNATSADLRVGELLALNV